MEQEAKPLPKSNRPGPFKRWLLHKLIGHLPYFTYMEKGPQGLDGSKHYRCLWCDEEFTNGVYNWLFDKSNRRI